MGIVTLTTDLGYKDYYVSAIKGRMLSYLPQTTVVDISHEIPPFNISKAAFVLKNAYKHFPKNSVHIVGVSPERTKDNKHLLIYHNNHYFIGADNGIFSLTFEEKPTAIYEITLPLDVDDLTFPTKSIFVKIAAHVLAGGEITEVAQPIENLNAAHTYMPAGDSDRIIGTVIYIDNYGNVITNISEKYFHENGRGRNFTIFLKDSDYNIKNLSESYGDVPEGEKLALFNSSDLLEISINKGVNGAGGSANTLLGLELFGSIRIEFHDH